MTSHKSHPPDNRDLKDNLYTLLSFNPSKHHIKIKLST